LDALLARLEGGGEALGEGRPDGPEGCQGVTVTGIVIVAETAASHAAATSAASSAARSRLFTRHAAHVV
jgi:hypothetical protein